MRHSLASKQRLKDNAVSLKPWNALAHHRAPMRQVAAAHAAAGAAPSQQTITGLREIVSDFDGVLLDQFGVLHDGRTPYSSAIEAVAQLSAAGKQIVIVSNSSRRSGNTISKLAKMGFDASCFKGAITSGELTHRYLESRPDPWWGSLGRRCIHLTWSSRGIIRLDGLGLEVVESPEDADFILAHGTEAVATPQGAAAANSSRSSSSGGDASEQTMAQDASLDELKALLQRCAAEAARRGRAMPMVVANPDIVTVDGAGGLITMPGTLAEWYSEMGGEVKLMGKPGPLIYEAASQIAPTVEKGRWLAIGDSLQHDVGGCLSAGAGLALFIASGIHADDLRLEGPGSNAGSKWDAGALQRLCEEHSAIPTHVAAWLEW